MMEANKQPPSFSHGDIRKILGAKEAQQLLQLLSSGGGCAVEQAAAAAKSGNYDKALSLLQPMINTPDSAKLLKEIQKKLG